MSIVSKYIETNYIWCCWLIWKFCIWLTSQIINCSSGKTPFFMMFMFWCFFASQIVWKSNFSRNIGLICTPYIKMDTIDLSRFNRLSIYGFFYWWVANLTLSNVSNKNKANYNKWLCHYYFQSEVHHSSCYHIQYRNMFCLRGLYDFLRCIFLRFISWNSCIKSDTFWSRSLY